jgi:hypothetical protein
MTAKQQAAIAKLRAMRDAGQLVPSGRYNMIRTGLNTTVLHNLRDMGLIKCNSVWLRGNCSDDLQVL